MDKETATIIIGLLSIGLSIINIININKKHG